MDTLHTHKRECVLQSSRVARLSVCLSVCWIIYSRAGEKNRISEEQKWKYQVRKRTLLLLLLPPFLLIGRKWNTNRAWCSSSFSCFFMFENLNIDFRIPIREGGIHLLVLLCRRWVIVNNSLLNQSMPNNNSFWEKVLDDKREGPRVIRFLSERAQFWRDSRNC